MFFSDQQCQLERGPIPNALGVENFHAAITFFRDSNDVDFTKDIGKSFADR